MTSDECLCVASTRVLPSKAVWGLQQRNNRIFPLLALCASKEPVMQSFHTMTSSWFPPLCVWHFLETDQWWSILCGAEVFKQCVEFETKFCFEFENELERKKMSKGSIDRTLNAFQLSGTWWRHQIETFSVLLALYQGNPLNTGGSPQQRPVTRSFDAFLFVAERLSKQSSLRRHRAHYDVTVMIFPPGSVWGTEIEQKGADCNKKYRGYSWQNSLIFPGLSDFPTSKDFPWLFTEFPEFFSDLKKYFSLTFPWPLATLYVVLCGGWQRSLLLISSRITFRSLGQSSIRLPHA